MTTKRSAGGPPSVEQLETRCLMSADVVDGIWKVQGGGQAPISDNLVIDRDPANPQMLRAFRNGTLEGIVAESQIHGIRVEGGAGADRIRIDEQHGVILLPATAETGVRQARPG